MTARGATSGSPFFDDYRVEASTGNAASPSTMFLQLGNWISAPAYRTFGIRRRYRRVRPRRSQSFFNKSGNFAMFEATLHASSLVSRFVRPRRTGSSSKYT